MAEFIGGEPILVNVDEPITFENKTDTAFDVGCGIMFHKSGLYRVSIVGRHVSVAVEPERKMGKWIVTNEFDDCCYAKCNQCNVTQIFYYGKPLTKYCPNCGCKMEKEIENF